METEAFTVKKAVFLKSMKRTEDYPNSDLPEIAVAGKSNAGKSSLINYLTNNSKLSYVSKQPGKTRLINFFVINDTFLLVDLPGYGFAKVSKAEQYSWGQMMDSFFATAKNLRSVLILVDIRHKPTNDDLTMIEYCAHYKMPFALIATKADKIAKSKRYNYMKTIKNYIEEKTQLSNFKIFPVSSTAKKGKEEIINYIDERIKTP